MRIGLLLDFSLARLTACQADFILMDLRKEEFLLLNDSQSMVQGKNHEVSLCGWQRGMIGV